MFREIKKTITLDLLYNYDSFSMDFTNIKTFTCKTYFIKYYLFHLTLNVPSKLNVDMRSNIT